MYVVEQTDCKERDCLKRRAPDDECLAAGSINKRQGGEGSYQIDEAYKDGLLEGTSRRSSRGSKDLRKVGEEGSDSTDLL